MRSKRAHVTHPHPTQVFECSAGTIVGHPCKRKARFCASMALGFESTGAPWPESWSFENADHERWSGVIPQPCAAATLATQDDLSCRPPWAKGAPALAPRTIPRTSGCTLLTTHPPTLLGRGPCVGLRPVFFRDDDGQLCHQLCHHHSALRTASPASPAQLCQLTEAAPVAFALVVALVLESVGDVLAGRPGCDRGEHFGARCRRGQAGRGWAS